MSAAVPSFGVVDDGAMADRLLEATLIRIARDVVSEKQECVANIRSMREIFEAPALGRWHHYPLHRCPP